jgi:hypothetical protein
LTRLTRRTAIATGASTALVPARGRTQPTDLIRFELVRSAFIEPRTVHVWLPSDYHTSRRRYRVIYMHDGQNLFVPAYGFRGQCWHVDQAMQARATGSQAIIVGIWNTAKRRADYSASAIEALLPEALRSRILTENGGHSLGDAYLRFIVQELKPMIDQTFRTRPARKDTSIMGASRGGMISLYGLCEYPNVFGPNANPVTDVPAISTALSTYLAAKLPNPHNHTIWMDHGTVNLDSLYRPYQERVDRIFSIKNWRKGKDYVSQVYEGADHNEAAWKARTPEVLDFVLRRYVDF